MATIVTSETSPARLNGTGAEGKDSVAHANYDGLIQAARQAHTKPLWAEMSKLNPPLPNPHCIPHVWRYEEVRPALLRAGELVTEKQAERRVLMLVNPNRGLSHSLCLPTSIYLHRPKILLTPPTHFMLAYNWSCRTIRRLLIVIQLSPCALSSKAKGVLQLCKAEEFR